MKHLTAFGTSILAPDSLFDRISDLLILYPKIDQSALYAPLLRKSIELSRIAKNQRQEAYFLYLLGDFYLERNQIENSQVVENQLEKLKNSINISFEQGKFFLHKAAVATSEIQHLKALEYYFLARDLFEKEPNRSQALATINFGLSDIYNKLKNYKKAIFFTREALQYEISEADPQFIPSIYLSLGINYMRVGELDSAVHFHTKALEMGNTNNFPGIKAQAYSNLANVYRRQKKLDAALAAIDSSDLICREEQISFGLFINRINRAEVYLDREDNQLALAELKEAGKELHVYSNPGIESEYYDTQSKVYEKLGQHALALEALKRHMNLENDLARVETERTLYEWENRTQKIKKEREIATLNESILLNKLRTRRLYFVVILSLLLGAALIYYFYNQKNVAQLRAKLEKEESDNLRMEVHRKDRELLSLAMNLKTLLEFTKTLREKFIQIKRDLPVSRQEALNNLLKDFEKGIPEPLWKDFKLRFETIHETFYSQLLEICPELTPTEIKLASYLRMNLTSKEIAQLTSRSIGTISNTRSSLRKKLNLDTDENLTSFLISL